LEILEAFVWREVVASVAEAIPEGIDGSAARFAQPVFARSRLLTTMSPSDKANTRRAH
jgi:hypothetical protein